jgi:predicted dehydrogenase
MLDPADPTLPAGAITARGLSDVVGDGDAVVHVCSGPDSHAEIVSAAYQLGFRRFIVEKPMAVSMADALRLVTLVDDGDAEIMVVSNWTASALTDEIRRVMLARAGAPPSEIVLVQVKPRLERTLTNGTHRSAFDVEMPHLVALAQCLADGPLKVVAASHADLVIGDECFPAMGAATITLRTAGGVPILLRSDLTAPWRERSTRIDWADGTRLVGFHPCDSTDRYAQLYTWVAGGEYVGRQFLHDDTVRRLLRSAYAYFAGIGPKPPNDVGFGAVTTAVIDAARAASKRVEYRPEHLVEVGHAPGIRH